MSFSYDLSTTTGKMRLLLGDTNSSSPNFQDEELSTIADITTTQLSGNAALFGEQSLATNDVLFHACANAVDSLAARIGSGKGGQTYKLGDYEITGSDQVKTLQDIAQRFRDAINNMPAWSIVQENLSGFNELTIIRNWVLRTEY